MQSIAQSQAHRHPWPPPAEDEFRMDRASRIDVSQFLSPDHLDPGPSSVGDTNDIAPWSVSPVDEDPPPTPPPKSRLGFGHKPSFASLAGRNVRGSASSANLSSRDRASDASSSSYTLVSGSGFASTATLMSTSGDPNVNGRTGRQLRKEPSNGWLNLKRFRPKSRQRPGTSVGSSDLPPVPPLRQPYAEENRRLHPSLPSPDYSMTSFLPIAGAGNSTVPSVFTPPSSLGHSSKTGRKEKKSAGVHYQQAADPQEAELKLDMNWDEMDDIVDFKAVPHFGNGSMAGQLDISSGSSTLFDGSASDSGHSGHRVVPQHDRLGYMHHPPADTMFINPFSSPLPNHALRIAQKGLEHGVSPKTIIAVNGLSPPGPNNHLLDERNYTLRGPHSIQDPSWQAPESWAVGHEQDDGAGGGTSSEDEDPLAPVASTIGKFPNKEHRPSSGRKVSKPSLFKPFKIRIYRANNTYHVVSIGLDVKVEALLPSLNHKLLSEKTETHRLYLKERGRERVLAQHERPADLLRRRLEQAGYDVADGLDMLGAEDLQFLMKFVYKSNVLGPAEEELAFESFEYADLTGRGLKTVPVVLYPHADEIVSLNLSRNPMLEIPLDFVQSCTTLRELRLSNMAMKKVPQSARHCVTLHRLDLSCNRIGDLEEARLDLLPELTTLKLQNNRIERLPLYFVHLRCLRFLNISNNKFKQVPAVVCEMASLVDLDLSFNMITELPEEVGQLELLERLIIVGNQISRLPVECGRLRNLVLLDCRRNNISDLSVVCKLPSMDALRADYNAVHGLELCLGPKLNRLEVSRNDITQLTLVPGPVGHAYALTLLDVSHAKLSILDDYAFANLTSLQTLKLDHNTFRSIPDSLGDLAQLVHFSCSNNQLDALPASIGRLQRLETLDVNNNSLTELPASLWNCASLIQLNATSNLLAVWHDPPVSGVDTSAANRGVAFVDRKTSAAESVLSIKGRQLPPLAYSLESLHLGENRLTDEVLNLLTVLKELKVLNLSFNEIQEMPLSFFRNLSRLEELYLSGNKLASIPTEDLHKLTKLSTLFLNGNKLQTLPQELGKVQSLAFLDVGSNILKYNIHNWEFDWNWNFNQNLRYLNLSGNKRLEIKPDGSARGHMTSTQQRKMLADFSGLTQLKVLGLMDVTTTFVPNIPDEHDDRRVRTSLSEVNHMAYGIADSIGKSDHLTMFDLVQPNFRGRQNEAIFAMFGRAQTFASSSRLSKYLYDNFVNVFSGMLDTLDSEKGEGVEHAMRRAFLKLNKYLYDYLLTSNNTTRKASTASASTSATGLRDYSIIRNGASGVALYLVDRTMYVANAGNCLAVVSKQGSAQALSRLHQPFDRDETARIRAAEGWVSPKGFVNEEIDVSRSFGFYHLLPVVNSRPDVTRYELSPLDEFVIIGNRGLWDYVSFQTAVDITRPKQAGDPWDPMIAAQKLRDFAISYGSDGSTMIMVVSVADLFARTRQPTLDPIPPYAPKRPPENKGDTRFPREVDPPTGHIALVFTDIRNSTHLWEANAGMATAMRLHNNLLRRLLRFCGGYEVKTEGDAFMCSFPTTLEALWWCLSVQDQLLHEAWPLEILECEDGQEIHDQDGVIIARGLSVRMGIHCGSPLCEPDPVTRRMDYLGPMPNRAARISSSAAGGQIMASADVVREIDACIFESGLGTEYSPLQPQSAIEAIKQLGVTVVGKGETKLKGMEMPEMLSWIYPEKLAGRQHLAEDPNDVKKTEVPYSVAQMQELALLCVRLETLTTSRVYRPLSERKGSIPGVDPENPAFMCCDASLMLPTISEKLTVAEMTALLDALSVRIENALSSLALKHMRSVIDPGLITRAARGEGCLDERTLQTLLSLW